MKVLLVLVLLLLVACDGSNVPTEAPPPPTQSSDSEFTLLGSNVTSGVFGPIVMGVYKYNGGSYRKTPVINVTMSAANGTVLATGEAFITPDFIAPGSLVPFKAYANGSQDKYDNLEITISAEEASSDYLSTHSTEFEVTNTSLVQASSLKPFSEPLRVVGSVTNKSAKNARDLHVLVVLYDKQGKVVAVYNTFVVTPYDSLEILYDEQGNMTGIDPNSLDSDELPPGASEPFSVEFYAVDGATKFDIVVDGEIDE